MINTDVLGYFSILLSLSDEEFRLFDAIFGGDNDVPNVPEYQLALDVLMSLADD